jgi:hypothetical protein
MPIPFPTSLLRQKGPKHKEFSGGTRRDNNEQKKFYLSGGLVKFGMQKILDI